MATDWTAILAGKVVGEYRLGVLRGEGHFGLVFEAENIHSGATAAVKLLKPGTAQSSPGDVADFNNEGDILALLEQCDGSISIFDRGQYAMQGTVFGQPVEFHVPYQVMNLAETDLSDYAESEVRQRIDLLEVFSMWRSAVLSLSRVHASNVAHRDIKADNCLVFFDKSGKPLIRFCDFGRAKDLTSPPTRDEDLYRSGRGHLFHRPPEGIYLQGGPSGADFVAADYYGIGSILVELLTGFSITQLVFGGNFREAQNQALYDFGHGRRQEMSVLIPRFQIAIGSVLDAVPKHLRSDLKVLLEILCHPDPYARLQPGPFRRDRNEREPLHWVLRRVDIMTAREKIVRREQRRNQGKGA